MVSFQTPLDFFYEISAIPRKSGDEQGISDYLVDFADKHHLECLRDEALNVCIKKPGTAGYENHSPVIMQAHMDMVYEAESPRYPYGEPLRIRREDRRLHAEGTSLGADNGIGMAYALAILAAGDIPHPPLEAVFTVQEEDGLIGASKLAGDWLTGKALINLDNEEEAVMPVGCAGAFRAKLYLDGEREKFYGPAEYLSLCVSGLSGGHSGLMIGQEGGNAIQLLSRILYELFQSYGIRLNAINGGARMNNIPVRSDASFCIAASKAAMIREAVPVLKQKYLSELSRTDPDFSLTITSISPGAPATPFSAAATGRILGALLLMPNGPLSMSKEFPGVVQSSSNTGVIETSGGTVTITAKPRSSMDSQKRFLKERMESLAGLVSARLEIDSEYPAWEYSPVSPLRDLYAREYSSRYGKKIQFRLLHGGLECGVLKEKYQLDDVISIGPDIFNVHSVKETLDLDSVERVWNCLTGILKGGKYVLR
jgi:dipeptidase D